MKSKPKKAYEVGYGKPPVATRFKKGQSGNLNGRPPKKVTQELDPGKILQSIDNEEIFVFVDGKRKLMRKAEIEFRQTFTKAIKGDLTAARLIANMATKYCAPETKGPSEIEFIVVPDEELYPGTSNTEYRNPPKESQFKKSRRNGRPKKRIVSTNYLFQKVAKEKISIEVQGVRVMMTRMEAYLRQIQIMACKNVSAARLLIQLRKQFPGDAAGGDKITFIISETDAKL
jgi:hypothetical protein